MSIKYFEDYYSTENIFEHLKTIDFEIVSFSQIKTKRDLCDVLKHITATIKDLKILIDGFYRITHIDAFFNNSFYYRDITSDPKQNIQGIVNKINCKQSDISENYNRNLTQTKQRNIEQVRNKLSKGRDSLIKIKKEMDKISVDDNLILSKWYNLQTLLSDVINYVKKVISFINDKII